MVLLIANCASVQAPVKPHLHHQTFSSPLHVRRLQPASLCAPLERLAAPSSVQSSRNTNHCAACARHGSQQGQPLGAFANNKQSAGVAARPATPPPGRPWRRAGAGDRLPRLAHHLPQPLPSLWGPARPHPQAAPPAAPLVAKQTANLRSPPSPSLLLPRKNHRRLLRLQLQPLRQLLMPQPGPAASARARPPPRAAPRDHRSNNSTSLQTWRRRLPHPLQPPPPQRAVAVAATAAAAAAPSARRRARPSSRSAAASTSTRTTRTMVGGAPPPWRRRLPLHCPRRCPPPPRRRCRRHPRPRPAVAMVRQSASSAFCAPRAAAPATWSPGRCRRHPAPLPLPWPSSCASTARRPPPPPPLRTSRALPWLAHASAAKRLARLRRRRWRRLQKPKRQRRLPLPHHPAKRLAKQPQPQFPMPLLQLQWPPPPRPLPQPHARPVRARRRAPARPAQPHWWAGVHHRRRRPRPPWATMPHTRQPCARRRRGKRPCASATRFLLGG